MQTVIGLDVGEKRIGVAHGDNAVRIAVPYGVVAMNDEAVIEIEKLINKFGASTIVVGLPRNSQGEETQQSQYVRDFVEKLRPLGLPVVLQDESLTSVQAEATLGRGGRTFDKSAVDAEAAAIILSDYLEANLG